jgi:hypothetical protein
LAERKPLQQHQKRPLGHYLGKLMKRHSELETDNSMAETLSLASWHDYFRDVWHTRKDRALGREFQSWNLKQIVKWFDCSWGCEDRRCTEKYKFENMWQLTAQLRELEEPSGFGTACLARTMSADHGQYSQFDLLMRMMTWETCWIDGIQKTFRIIS